MSGERWHGTRTGYNYHRCRCEDCAAAHRDYRRTRSLTWPSTTKAQPNTWRGVGCSVDGCNKPVTGRGWCKTHYAYWLRHGIPVYTPPTPEERFWSKVKKTDDCWLWTAAKNKGYGVFRPDNKTNGYAHRFAYELLVGPIPEGLYIDHLCRVPACVNPAHMEPVTLVENVLRGYSTPAIRARARKAVAS